MSYQKKYEVRVRESEEQPILTRRQKMSVEEFGAYYGKIFERIAREGLNPDGVTLAIYHDQEFDPACSDIELGVGIREREQADKTLPVRTCAVTIHKGGLCRPSRRLWRDCVVDSRKWMGHRRSSL